MCGILGLIAAGDAWRNGTHVSPARVTKALRLMAYRGPDASRLTFFSASGSAISVSPDSDLSYLPPAQVVLGHNRLSIIDVSPDAHQPMPYGNLWLSYNGEVYNFRDQRAVLIEQGYPFQTQSDTEVLLALYAHFGTDMLQRLNGMFAFALWDNDRRQLFLARDRYGVKPLYYTRLPGGEFAFASEIKSLLALGADKTLDYTALSEHLTFQNTFEDRTLLKHIRMLPPGHWAMLAPETGDLQIHSYWEPVFNPDQGINPAEAIHTLRRMFEKAVSRQLVGDVPIGSFLSGGMDTGAITAVTTRALPNLHTFTAGFDVSNVTEAEQLFDERTVSRQLAELLGTRHHEMTIEAGALPLVLPQVVWHLDDFRAGISYQNYLVSRMVRQFVTVVLSGVGGDELFAGYPWRYDLKTDGASLSRAPGPAALDDQYYQRWVRLLSEEEKQQLFTPDTWRQLDGFSSRDSFQRVFAGCRAEDPLNKMLCFDMKTFLHGLLVVEDRLSMAHSVESRVPFLDNDLVDFCLTLPAEVKLKGSASGQEATSKWILKEAFKGLLPDEVLTRRKQGFTPPDASWYRGETRRYIEDLLLSPHASARGLFEPAGIQNLLEAHFNGQRNHRFLIWSLMCLETWHRLLIDPPEPVAPPEMTALSGAHIL